MRALPAAPRRRPNAYQGVLNFNTNDEVLSYVSRNLEPVRGFQVFMRTLPAARTPAPSLWAATKSATATPPVQEFAARVGASTLGFFDSEAYAEALTQALANTKGPRQPVNLPEISIQHCVAQ
jgi:hypothetical protein